MAVAVERSPKSREAIALLHVLAEARRGSNDAMAALIANDLSTRPEIKEKRAYEQEGYRAAAASFGIPVEEAITYDLKQKKSVPSDAFTAAVKLFQKENGLATTGELNYPMLKAKSGANIPEVIASFERKSP